MQVSLETLSGLERKMTVSLTDNPLHSKIEARLRTMARETRTNGFRPGKTPISMVRRRYGSAIHDEILNDLIQTSFEEAVKEQALNVAGGLRIDSIKDEEECVEYIALFDIKPEIELLPLADQTISRPLAEIVESDIDAMIAEVRQQALRWETVDRGAKLEDRVAVRLHGSVAGEVIKELDREARLVLGKEQGLPGLDEQLQGRVTDDQRSFSLPIPEGYGVEMIAGKTVDCEITVLAVEQAILPEVDEAFIKGLAIASGEVADLRHEVRLTMEAQLQQAIENNLKTQVIDVLIGLHPIELPPSLVEQEIQQLKINASISITGKAEEETLKALPRELFEEKAKRAVHFGLLMVEILAKNSIQVDQALVAAHARRAASSYQNTAEAEHSLLHDEKELKKFHSMALEDQVVAWAMAQTQVTERKSSFKELAGVNPKNEEAT